MRHGSLLVVDDDLLTLDATADWLREKGFGVSAATTCGQARALIDASAFDLVLADIRLQDGDGFDILRHCRVRRPETAVILVTGYATNQTEAEAIRSGACDLLSKPLRDDRLESAIARALARRPEHDPRHAADSPAVVRFGMENIVGLDHRMLKVFDVIDSIANTRATVLITGESGTGKSLVARAIHRRSERRAGPFVEVACGALPETLLESELFGHVAGSFTGAVGDKTGKFKQSDGGTIFLDEISTASPNMQVKLLRVLQELEFEPVGGIRTIRVDTRVILATNEDLTRAVAAGRFRQDLYYRINVINVELPPLRSRAADIPLLAQHFLARVREDSGKQVEGFSDEALAALQAYAWPGNVRELQNVVERSVLLGKRPWISLDDLPGELTKAMPAPPRRSTRRTLKEALEAPERQIILETLQQQNWNRNATAEQLGINRTTLYKKMKRLGLESPFPHWSAMDN